MKSSSLTLFGHHTHPVHHHNSCGKSMIFLTWTWHCPWIVFVLNFGLYLCHLAFVFVMTCVHVFVFAFAFVFAQRAPISKLWRLCWVVESGKRSHSLLWHDRVTTPRLTKIQHSSFLSLYFFICICVFVFLICILYSYFCICISLLWHDRVTTHAAQLNLYNWTQNDGAYHRPQTSLFFYQYLQMGWDFLTFLQCCRVPFLNSSWTSTVVEKLYLYLCLYFIICICISILCFIAVCPFLNSGWTSTVVEKLWAPFRRHLDRTTCPSLSLYLYFELQCIWETSVQNSTSFFVVS